MKEIFPIKFLCRGEGEQPHAPGQAAQAPETSRLTSELPWFWVEPGLAGLSIFTFFVIFKVWS